MRTTLIALSLGVAMLGSASLAQADTTAPSKAQQTAEQSKMAIAQQLQASEPLVLTDNQMEKVTAGHWINKPYRIWHNGWFRTHYDGHWHDVYGWHFGVFHQ